MYTNAPKAKKFSFNCQKPAKHFQQLMLKILIKPPKFNL